MRKEMRVCMYIHNSINVLTKMATVHLKDFTISSKSKEYCMLIYATLQQYL